MLCGDFNVLTGKMNANSDDFIFNGRNQTYECERESNDNIVDTIGQSLLSLCLTFDLCIVIGLSRQYSELSTFVSENGCSVIDYVIVSVNLLYLCESLNVKGSSASSHMPVLRQRRRTACPIEQEQCAEHFKEVYADIEGALLPKYENIRPPDELSNETDCLNERVFEKEVVESIMNLRGGKAGGIDGMIEIMICSTHVNNRWSLTESIIVTI